MIGRRAPIIMVIGDLAQIGVEANDKKKKKKLEKLFYVLLCDDPLFFK